MYKECFLKSFWKFFLVFYNITKLFTDESFFVSVICQSREIVDLLQGTPKVAHAAGFLSSRHHYPKEGQGAIQLGNDVVTEFARTRNGDNQFWLQSFSFSSFDCPYQDYRNQSSHLFYQWLTCLGFELDSARIFPSTRTINTQTYEQRFTHIHTHTHHTYIRLVWFGLVWFGFFV